MDQPAAPLARRRPRDAGGGRSLSPPSMSEPDRAQALRGERLVVPLLWAAAALITGSWTGLVAAVVRWIA